MRQQLLMAEVAQLKEKVARRDETISRLMNPQSSGYNGWTNRETWQVNLYFGDRWAARNDDGESVSSDVMLAEVSEELAQENHMTVSGGLLSDIVSDFISAVDFEELEEAFTVKDEEEDDLD